MLKKIDLTKGNIWKGLLIFVIPLLIGNVFQQAYSLVDAIIVGQTLSAEAFTGVSVTGSASSFILGFASGLCSGLAVPVAQFYGAKDEKSVRKSMATGFVIAAIAGLLLTGIGLACCRPLLLLLNTRSEVFSYAEDYLWAIFSGIVFTVFYNVISFYLRSLGDSVTPLIALVVACLLNIGLDFLFIAVLNMGTAGAGWATVIANLCSALVCFFSLYKRFPSYRIKLRDFQLQKGMVLNTLKISLPMALQYSIIGIGLMVQQSAVNSLGYIAGTEIGYDTAYGAAGKIDGFSNCVIMALGTAMATFAGQNYGSRDLERIKKGLKIGTILGLLTVALMAAIIIPLTPYIMKLFISVDDPALNEATLLYMSIDLGMYALLTLLYTYRSALQGLGKSFITMIVGAIELAMRISAALLLAHFGGWLGLCFSNPCSWFISDIVLIPALIHCLRVYTQQVKDGTFGQLKTN